MRDSCGLDYCDGSRLPMESVWRRGAENITFVSTTGATQKVFGNTIGRIIWISYTVLENYGLLQQSKDTAVKEPPRAASC